MNKTKPTISDKTKIREEVQHKISLLGHEEKNKAAQVVSQKLLELDVFQKCTNIILYESLGDEVSLEDFIIQARKQGKNIVSITQSGDVSHVPQEGIILVPGRAFTLSGKRIGRGGGWYDRFLRQYPYLTTIGVCFGCQIFDDIPQDIWDISLETVVYSSIQSGQ